MIIPLVLVCVVIMSLLGTVLMSSSTAEYSQSALVGYGLRARELALAALEESRAVVYDNLNNPATPKPWHQKLFDACKTQEANRGVLFTENIKNALSRSRALASAAGGDLMSAEVAFLGFRPVHFISTDLFRSPESFYRNPDGRLDPPTGNPPPREYNGYYRVRVQCRFGKVARVFSELHDVKIVGVAPPARQFALFSNFPTTDSSGNAGGTGQQYIWRGLNDGAGFRVFGNDLGRIFVRGPFIVETEGWPGGDGEGDGTPRTGPAGYNDRHWYKWRTVPATRDGVVSRIAFFWPRGPARPERTSRSRFIIGMITGLLGGAGDALLGLDPGFNILNGQQWYCESRGRDGNSFTILGNGQTRFLGVVTVHSASNRAVQAFDSRAFAFGNELWATPPNRDARWVIEPEGGLIGLYNIVSYSYSKFPWPTKLYERYRLSYRGNALVRFGAHWEKEYTQSFFSAFFGALFEAGAFALMGASMGLIPIPALIPIAPGVALLGPPAIALGTVGAAIGSELTRPDNFRAIGNLNPSAARGIFPPGYRLVRRSVTRMYPSFKDIPSRKDNRTLVLDGVLGFDDMNYDRAFRYRGKGFIYSDNPAPPALRGSISSFGTINDWMTVHYDGPSQNAQSGDQMLGLAGTVIGSVYSTQGVKPAGTPVTISGNMTCGFINKHRNQQRVNVNYDAGKLFGDHAAFDNGNWHVSAISMRACQMYDK